MGREVLAGDIRQAKLSPGEQRSLQEVLDRVASGQLLPRDVKHITEYGLWEVVFSGDRRTFRLLYAKRGKAELLLVGVLFTIKKKQRLSASTFATARTRVAEWDSRNPGE